MLAHRARGRAAAGVKSSILSADGYSDYTLAGRLLRVPDYRPLYWDAWVEARGLQRARSELLVADDGIQKRVEELAEAAVFADASDYQRLATLHTGFEEVHQWAVDTSQPDVAAAAEAAVKLVEDLVLEQACDAAAALGAIGRTVSALQAIIRDGRSPDQVVFPPELQRAEPRAASAPADDAADGLVCATSPSHPSSLPANLDEKMVADFLARYAAVLQEMEALFLRLGSSDDERHAAQLRTLLRTLQDDAAILGLQDVQRLCVTTQDALRQSPPKDLAQTVLAARERLQRAFDAYAGRAPSAEAVETATGSPAAGQLPAAQASGPRVAAEAKPTGSSASSQPDGSGSLLAEFVGEAREHLDAADVHLLTLEGDARNEDALHAVFRVFHTIKGIAGFLGLDQIGGLAHEAENLLDRARKGQLALAGPPMDVIFEAVDALKRLVGGVADGLSSGQAPPNDDVLPLLLERIKQAASQPAPCPPAPSADPAAARQQRRTAIQAGRGPDAVRPAMDAASSVEPGEQPRCDASQRVASSPGGVQAAGPPAVQLKETVKVDADRLDRLVNTIGELVITESMVSQSAELKNAASAPLGRQLGQLDKITRQLQEMATSLRMVPVRPTFQKMARLVRDLAKKAGKPIEFVASGEDTELDKAVVDKIGDPLVHMMRNAVDHGIEADPEQRRKAGKPETGRVALRAFHKGGNIHIEVEDDGRGLDREAILATARQRGLVAEGQSLSDREVFDLIFQPGFSTAERVTDVSGRGVGMDVVKRSVEALRGQIDIRSAPGKGSLVAIRLPLTLAIIDGMILRVRGERYIIPALSVVRSVRLEPKNLVTALQRAQMLRLDDRLIPLLRLDRLLHIDGDEPNRARLLAVVVENERQQIGLLVDDVLGQQQIVIKSLGQAMRGLVGICGGAILPDGRVGLILDVAGLIRLAGSDQAQAATRGGGPGDGRPVG